MGRYQCMVPPVVGAIFGNYGHMCSSICWGELAQFNITQTIVYKHENTKQFWLKSRKQFLVIMDLVSLSAARNRNRLTLSGAGSSDGIVAATPDAVAPVLTMDSSAPLLRADG